MTAPTAPTTTSTASTASTTATTATTSAGGAPSAAVVSRPGSRPTPSGTPQFLTDPTILPTVALAVVTLVVAAGFGRLFATGGFLGPVLATGVAVHVTAWAARRAGVPTFLAMAAAGVVTALVASWTVLPSSTAYGIPWRGTWQAASDAIATARQVFSEVAAPTEVLPGFVLAACVGVGICAFTADWAAFRIGTPLEACLPAFTLFLFTSALGSPNHRALAVAGFAVAALGYFGIHQVWQQSRPGAWFGNRQLAGTGAVLQFAAVLAAVATVAGLVLGPSLPGAGADPVIAYRGIDRVTGGNNRTTISPLVDIRSRLVDRRGTEAFTVQADRRAYWRLTSLDDFNGTIWRSNDTYRNASGSLTPGARVDTAGERVSQSFRIASLATLWLPHAYEPIRIDGIDGVSYNAPTGSLITENDTADGLIYRVESRVIDQSLSTDVLRTAPARAPAELAERFLRLPDDVPERVRNLAQELTRNATTPYDKARSLQDFFQSRFTYSLTVDNGHDNAALETFLFTTRAGYCEQFAGSYAVMARAVGLPTRVAVGFTPGQQTEDGTFVVRDLNAHAWPEVYLDGFGWVGFEPTPGRGAPFAEGYTGVEEAQDDTPLDPGAATPTTTPTTVAAGGTTSSVPDIGLDDPGAADVEPAPASQRALVVLGILAVLGAAGWAAGVPAARSTLRRRRRARALTSSTRVMVAWMETAEVLEQAGATRRPAETFFEYARRAARVLGLSPETSQSLRTLATDAAAATYGVTEARPEAVERSVRAAEEIHAAVAAAARPGQRLAWRLDPRPLLNLRQ